MHTKAAKLLATLLLCTLLCGCRAVNILVPMETIRAPHSAGEFEGVRAALEETVGSEIHMKYPKGDDGVASYMTADLDGDGLQEVLAFYCPDQDGSTTRIHLLRQDAKGHWASVQDIGSVGVELDTVRFADLDNDGLPEIVTGWRLYESKTMTMALYKMSDGQLFQRAQERYTDYVLFDINADHVTEIVLLLLSPTEKTASLSALNFSEQDGVTLAGRTVLDGGVSSYLSILVSNSDPAHPALYIDAMKGDASLTELVYWDGGLVNAFYDEQAQETLATYRPFTAVCREEAIPQNDPTLTSETSSQEEAEESEAEPSEPPVPRVLIPFAVKVPKPETAADDSFYYCDWRAVSRFGEDFSTESTGLYYENTTYDYRFRIPDNWRDTVTYRVVEKDSTVVFAALRQFGTGEELMRLRVFGKTQLEDAQSIGYELLDSDNTYIYTARLKEGDPLSLSLTDVIDSFSFR